MSFTDAQKTWQGNSEFSDQGVVYTEGYHDPLTLATTTEVSVFAGALADPNCSGVKVLEMNLYFDADITHDATNHFDVGIRQRDQAGSNEKLVSVSTDSYANITSATGTIKIPISTGDTFTFTANTGQLQLVFVETGTCNMERVSVFIRYRKVAGTNLAYSNATLAA